MDFGGADDGAGPRRKLRLKKQHLYVPVPGGESLRTDGLPEQHRRWWLDWRGFPDRVMLTLGQPDVLKVEDDSVWLPLVSMASTSHE